MTISSGFIVAKREHEKLTYSDNFAKWTAWQIPGSFVHTYENGVNHVQGTAARATERYYQRVKLTPGRTYIFSFSQRVDYITMGAPGLWMAMLEQEPNFAGGIDNIPGVKISCNTTSSQTYTDFSETFTATQKDYWMTVDWVNVYDGYSFSAWYKNIKLQGV